MIGVAPRTASADELVSYEVVDDISIPASLTGQPGDPKKGREVVINRKLGNCLACHSMPIPEEAFHGKTAPDLAGVADRYDLGELRLRVVNPKVINPDTMMPAFYRTEGLIQVKKDFVGKPILTAQQVEDVLAYLETLKQ
jgi:sulfur-oxidizing protein SoxX